MKMWTHCGLRVCFSSLYWLFDDDDDDDDNNDDDASVLWWCANK